MRNRAYNIRKLRYGDLVVVLLVSVVAVLSMWLIAMARAGDPGGAVVEVNGKQELKLPLGPGIPKREYTVRGWIGETTVVREGSRVRVKQSDCRDKLCVGSGWIDAPGETIVCLPNRVVVTVTSLEKGSVDAVTR